MINTEKLKDILSGYKEYFPSHWAYERYKWEAVKHFQQHWDRTADNFAEMFEKATDKTYNLLASQNFLPRSMVIAYAKTDDTAVRQMFVDLFDEDKDIDARIKIFGKQAKDIHDRYNSGQWGGDTYQRTDAISTYLWLKYPDKYYIYRYTICKDVADVLGAENRPKHGGSARSMLVAYAIYDEISQRLCQDPELRTMLDSVTDDACYPDPALRTLAIDVGYYISKFYLKEVQALKDGAEWMYPDYSPALSADDWEALLGDQSIFTENALQVVKRMKDYGGQATCKQLSVKYGESYNFYNTNSSQLAKRVVDKTGCPVLLGESGEPRYWPVLYLGKNAAASDDGEFIWRLRPELSEALERVDDEGTIAKYSDDDFLDEVFIDQEDLDTLKHLLRNKKNLILKGAPGVGKTFAAKRLAYAMMGEPDDHRIAFVQFHQNYSYEDFIMGYRPYENGFKLTKGVFYKFCQIAANSPDKDHFFIIDEINRGNMSKIFGEMLFSIEKDYRGTNVILPYSGTPFSVPDNLYIIGMMNTADRSLAMIDYALRRRFCFFEMGPGFLSDGFAKYKEALNNEIFNRLIEQIMALNDEIAQDGSLGAGFRIGHSYFCGRDASTCTEEWLRSVIRYEILPTLEEYWFDEPEKVDRWKDELSGIFND